MADRSDQDARPAQPDDASRPPLSQRERFREVLERKQQQAKDGRGEHHRDGGTVGGSQTARQRHEFRRKSG